MIHHINWNLFYGSHNGMKSQANAGVVNLTLSPEWSRTRSSITANTCADSTI